MNIVRSKGGGRKMAVNIVMSKGGRRKMAVNIVKKKCGGEYCNEQRW